MRVPDDHEFVNGRCKWCGFLEPGGVAKQEPSEGKTCAAMPDAVSITFNAFPIESAPRDRVVMVFLSGEWAPSQWKESYGIWIADEGEDYPTHWAELESMAVKP